MSAMFDATPAGRMLAEAFKQGRQIAEIPAAVRPKTVADAELIGHHLRPYLDGRDWVSINRGEVIDVEKLTGA